MTRVIHTGDTHLGYRQYHSPERRADFLAAFRRVVEDAIDEDVDAVVHAGDLFHDRSPSLLDVHGAIQVLRDLEEAGVPFLAVVGNHERTREGQWLDLFETLGLATRLGDEPTTIGDGGERVALYGLDFVPRSARDDLEYDFAAHDAEFAALVAHGLFTPFNAEWNTEEVLSASTVEFDAVLLGDDHQPDTARVEDAWVTYCGSTERTSAAEREERGYNLVDFDADAVGGDGPADREVGEGVSIRRLGIETRPFVTIDVELADGEGAERVRERVREEAVEDAVVVVSVEGEGDDLQPARIEEFARERGALIARVRDRREIEAAEAVESVSFADPDAAVRERIRELGLSEAALAIDETVRSDVADSNVRGRVRERVEALLAEPGAFEPGAPVEADGDQPPGEAEGEREPVETNGEPESERGSEPTDADGDEPVEEPTADDGPPEDVDPGPTDETAETETPVSAEATEPADEDDQTVQDSEPSAGDGSVTASAADDEADAEPDPETAADERDDDDGPGGGPDGQLSMEDYL